MAGTVTSNLTRVTAAEAADSASWEAIGGGAGSSQNQEIVIQGSDSRGRRIDNTTRGFSFDAVSTADISSAKSHVAWWANVLQPAALSTTDGVEVRLGSDTSVTVNFEGWFVLNNSSYPDIGGWQRVWLDVSRASDASSGTLNKAAVRHWGAEYSIGNVQGTAQNCLLDAIDYLAGGGIALLVDAGTVPSPATFDDFVAADEGNSTNKYGVVQTRDSVIFCLARLGIADATATIFNASAFVLIFADQSFVASDWMGITVDLQNASTDVDMADATIRSAGTTQGDLIVTGTSGAFDALRVTLGNLRTIDLTSVVTLTDCQIQDCDKLNQVGAIIDGCIVTGATTADAEAFLISDDPSKISDCSFTFSDGHAIEITAPGTYTFSGNKFFGYGAGGTNDAAIFNNSGGAVTLNITGGGDTPTIRNGAGASTTVNNTVTLTLTVKDEDDVAILNAQCYIEGVGGAQDGVQLMNEDTLASGIATESFDFVSDQNILVRVRKSSTPDTKYVPFFGTGTITSSGFDLPVRLVEDAVAT